MEDSRSRFAAIARLIAEWQPVLLVVGVPFPSADREHETARLARRFARRLEGRFRIPTQLIDERLTTHAADSARRAQGAGRRQAGATLDAAAAQHILQTYFTALDTRAPLNANGA